MATSSRKSHPSEKPSKTCLVEDGRPETNNILKLCFSDDVLKVSLFTNHPSNLSWYHRVWTGILYILGITKFLSRNDLGSSVVIREEDYGKLLTITTMAYLRQIQKKKTGDIKHLNKT